MITSLSPLERLANVVVNLGLGDAMRAGELSREDAMRIIDCIRGADQYAATRGEPPFPWTDEEIVNRLVLASRMHTEARA